MMMDTYKIRKLKNEYVFIHDYIEQNMSLLNDLTARCLFRALMAVASLDDISKWREAYANTATVRVLPSLKGWICHTPAVKKAIHSSNSSPCSSL